MPTGLVIGIPHLGDAGCAPIGYFVIAFAESIRLIDERYGSDYFQNLDCHNISLRLTMFGHYERDN
jgi:hypothetical protein